MSTSTPSRSTRRRPHSSEHDLPAIEAAPISAFVAAAFRKRKSEGPFGPYWKERLDVDNYVQSATLGLPPTHSAHEATPFRSPIVKATVDAIRFDSRWHAQQIPMLPILPPLRSGSVSSMDRGGPSQTLGSVGSLQGVQGLSETLDRTSGDSARGGTMQAIDTLNAASWSPRGWLESLSTSTLGSKRANSQARHAATQLAAWWKGCLARDLVWGTSGLYEHKMATEIQRIRRGFVIRMQYERFVLAKLNSTATTLQKYVRRLLAQCELLRFKIRRNHRMAIKIQCLIRRYCARCEYWIRYKARQNRTASWLQHQARMWIAKCRVWYISKHHARLARDLRVARKISTCARALYQACTRPSVSVDLALSVAAASIAEAEWIKSPAPAFQGSFPDLPMLSDPWFVTRVLGPLGWWSEKQHLALLQYYGTDSLNPLIPEEQWSSVWYWEWTVYSIQGRQQVRRNKRNSTAVSISTPHEIEASPSDPRVSQHQGDEVATLQDSVVAPDELQRATTRSIHSLAPYAWTDVQLNNGGDVRSIKRQIRRAFPRAVERIHRFRQRYLEWDPTVGGRPVPMALHPEQLRMWDDCLGRIGKEFSAMNSAEQCHTVRRIWSDYSPIDMVALLPVYPPWSPAAMVGERAEPAMYQHTYSPSYAPDPREFYPPLHTDIAPAPINPPYGKAHRYYPSAHPAQQFPDYSAESAHQDTPPGLAHFQIRRQIQDAPKLLGARTDRMQLSPYDTTQLRGAALAWLAISLHVSCRNLPLAERAYRTAMSWRPTDPILPYGLAMLLHTRAGHSIDEIFSLLARSAALDASGSAVELVIEPLFHHAASVSSPLYFTLSASIDACIGALTMMLKSHFVVLRAGASTAAESRCALAHFPCACR